MKYKFYCSSVACIVFSCVAMEHTVDRENGIAQVVAELREHTDSLLLDKEPAFTVMQEDIKAVRRSFYPSQRNVAMQDIHPRVIASIDSALQLASQQLDDTEATYKNSAQSSSLTKEEKQFELIAKGIAFKKTMQSLFASIDETGELYADKPLCVTHHAVALNAQSPTLVAVEALECFAKATDNELLLCASCKGCPSTLWCNDCVLADKAHSSITLSLQKGAEITRQQVGVHDALWYLHSRIGALSHRIDTYAANAQSQQWSGDDVAKEFAVWRKSLLQWPALHKDIIANMATMSDDQLTVDAAIGLLENSSKAIRIGEGVGALMQFFAINPGIVSADLQKLCDAAKDLPAGMTISGLAKKVQEGTKVALGVNDKDLLLLCQLLRIGSVPLNALIKQAVNGLRDSQTDVQRFGELYKKPMRTQLLTPPCSLLLQQMVHAWKTKGIVEPQNILVFDKPIVINFAAALNKGFVAQQARQKKEEVGQSKDQKQ